MPKLFAVFWALLDPAKCSNIACNPAIGWWYDIANQKPRHYLVILERIGFRVWGSLPLHVWWWFINSSFPETLCILVDFTSRSKLWLHKNRKLQYSWCAGLVKWLTPTLDLHNPLFRPTIQQQPFNNCSSMLYTQISPKQRLAIRNSKQRDPVN